MTAALALASPTGQKEWLMAAVERTDCHALEVASAVYDSNADGIADFIDVLIAFRDMQPDAPDASTNVTRDVTDGLRELEEVGLVVRVDDEITLTMCPLYDINPKEGN